jgi:hypothetical protein
VNGVCGFAVPWKQETVIIRRNSRLIILVPFLWMGASLSSQEMTIPGRVAMNGESR